MTPAPDLDPIEHLMESGLGPRTARQMVNTMQQATPQPVGAGAPEAARADGQRPFSAHQPCYVVVNGAVAGPWSLLQVQATLLTGTLAPEALCWAPGMPQWARACDVGCFHLPVTPLSPPPMYPAWDAP